MYMAKAHASTISERVQVMMVAHNWQASCFPENFIHLTELHISQIDLQGLRSDDSIHSFMWVECG